MRTAIIMIIKKNNRKNKKKIEIINSKRDLGNKLSPFLAPLQDKFELLTHTIHTLCNILNFHIQK